MAFDFKFEAVLKHRRHLEDVARKNYLEARKLLDDCLAGINRMYDGIDTARDDIAGAQRSGEPRALQNIWSSEQFIEGQKIRIQRERDRARALMVKAEEMHEKLIEAVKEFKKIEKLKERMKEQYKKDRRKLEAKRMDDLVVIRSGRGRAI